MQWQDLLPSISLDIQIERDRLTVTTRNRYGVFLPAVAGFLLIWSIGWVRQEWGNTVSLFVGLAICAVIALGLRSALPKHIVTSFDLDRRTVAQTTRAALSRHDTTTSYRFAEIASLGLKEAHDEGFSYMPVITLRTGQHRSIGAAGGSAFKEGQFVDKLCAATGLPRVDIPAQ